MTFNFQTVSTLLPAVRYHTEYDAYHFSVDNRPLTDLSSADSVISSAADANRRNLAHSQIASFLMNLSHRVDPTTSGILGLAIRQTAANTAAVGPGVYYAPFVNGTDQSATYQFLNWQDATVSLPAPSTAGMERWILIQLTPMAPSALTSGILPFQDPSNTLTNQANFVSGMSISTVVGSDATVGSAVQPTATNGSVAIGWVRMVAGSASIQAVQYYPNRLNSLGYAKLYSPVSNAAPTTQIGLAPVYQMATSGTNTVGFEIAPTAFLNGYVDLELQVYSTAAGTAAFNLSYVFAQAGTDLASAAVTTVQTSVNLAANQMVVNRVRLAISPIPGSLKMVGTLSRQVSGDTGPVSIYLSGMKVIQ